MKRFIQGKHNAKIAVEDSGQGKPVIFLHGWPINNNMYEYQYNVLLASGFRVIGIDLRGFGESDFVLEDYGYNTFADDVKDVIDELGIRKATLVGFSMGGAVAIRYMSRHDGLGIEKLVLLGAAAPVFTKRRDYPYGIPTEEVDDLIQQTKENRPEMIEGFGEKLFHKKPSEAYSNWMTGLALSASSYGTILAAAALREEDLRKDLEDILVPTLIAHGTKDEICPFELAEQLDERISNSQLVPFEKSGHALFHDELEKLNDTLLRFIS